MSWHIGTGKCASWTDANRIFNACLLSEISLMVINLPKNTKFHKKRPSPLKASAGSLASMGFRVGDSTSRLEIAITSHFCA
jgi:hypothetical protein